MKKLVLKTSWLRGMLNTATSLKLDEVEIGIVDGVPHSIVEDGKVVASKPGMKHEQEPAPKDKAPADKYPVWRVDEKLVAKGEGKPEFNIADLDEANAILIANELGLDPAIRGKDLSTIKKAIWTAIYGQ